MRNVRVLVAYDGSRFFGWQRQEGFLSVQEVLEEALEACARGRVVVHGSGRTDTGVHALGQTASFHLETRLGDDELLRAVNARLPSEVVARALETCREDFHAQRSARGKRYGYRLSTARFRPAFGRSYQHWVPGKLDFAAMRHAARHLIGEHDFTAFANAGSPRRSNVRRIDALHIVSRREALHFFVQGNGFLYNMVRTIVGTLVKIGHGKLATASVPEILASRNREFAGPTAPAEGLFLLRVLYQEPCFGR
jgi:tRNA pseudouridine38-40 synthase